MRWAETVHNAKEGLRRPQPWVGVLVFGMPFLVLRLQLLGDYLHHPAIWVSSLLIPFMVSAGFAWLAPMAWRWTGDQRPLAGLPRGIFQSLVWNALVVFGTVGMDYLLILLARSRNTIPITTAIWTNLIFMVPTMTLVGYFLAASEQGEADRARAELQSREARDRALQNQLSPHVLFNALNGLAELVRQDPGAAEQGLLDLADLYRRVLDQGQLPWAPLGEERALVERFLAVERLRLGERLHVIWEWDEALDRLMAPPLLLQPLVENAIKHGAGRRPGVFKVYITGRHVLGEVEVVVENEGDLQVKGGRRGIGMKNLAERLALHFPRESETFLINEGGWVKAGFRIRERAIGAAPKVDPDGWAEGGENREEGGGHA